MYPEVESADASSKVSFAGFSVTSVPFGRTISANEPDAEPNTSSPTLTWVRPAPTASTTPA